MPLRAGDRVDRFVIEGPLGQGGMGAVFRAKDERLGRSVALKILCDEGAPAKAATSRVLREARAAAALDHPNVVALFEVAEAQEPPALRGTPYMAMELIEGRPLRAYVGEPVPLATRISWLSQIAMALAAAHKRGLVHRDIKPENVMIRDDGVVKVLDFGIAKRAHQPSDPTASTETNTTNRSSGAGTPSYMSPEQLRGESLDGRSDQFAWGVTAYELLCGARPWAAGLDTFGLVAQILTTEVEPLAARNREISRHVEAVVLRALAKRRDERFATMDELLLALEPNAPRFAPLGSGAGSAEVAPTQMAATAAREPSGARRGWLAVTAVLVAVLAGAAGYAAKGARAPARASASTSPTPSAPEPSASAEVAVVPSVSIAPPSAPSVRAAAPPAKRRPPAPRPSSSTSDWDRQ